MIRKIVIRNYRIFDNFQAEFLPGVNIVVGANDSGKSTLLEAINLALTGRINGRHLAQELSPFLINLQATRDFVAALQGDPRRAQLPQVIIDLFLDGEDVPEILRGSNNLLGEDACGLRIQAHFSPEYDEEYARLIDDPKSVRLVPTEYYRVEWLGFSGNSVTQRSVPSASPVIDPTTIRLHSGSDYHLQQILRAHLQPRERAELSRQYRTLREEFSRKPEVAKVNERLKGDKGQISDRTLALSVDLSQRFTWEQSLTAHLDDLPFAYIGKGEQTAVKTLLAISRKAEDAHVVLLEEPENHASFAALRRLIKRIEERCEGKQVIIATHSSFVLNRLGLDRLMLLGPQGPARLTDLPHDTVAYFKKLSGYDTLRLVLAERVILVEGPSDELILQRAYRNVHGKDPIEDGIDVISVHGRAFKRFLDLAIKLKRRVAVVTDNDGKEVDVVRASYAQYLDHTHVTLHTGRDPRLKTLEPQIVAVNDLLVLSRVLGRAGTDADSLLAYMMENKTTAALAILEAEERIVIPEYIREALID